MKSHQNLEPNLTPKYGQIHRKSMKIMYYPLLKIHRKSVKIDNKFIENQWKSHEILAQNDPFLNEISDKIDYKLNQILAKIELKLSQIEVKSWPKHEVGHDLK